jgi:hypothetical protein
MEDIIALAVVVFVLVAAVVGAVLLRRRFIRSREQKIKLQQEYAEWFAKQNQDREQQNLKKQQEAVQLQDRAERLRVNGMQNVTPVYANLGNAAAQSSANITPYSTPGGGTTSAQPVNSGPDLLTIMALAGLASSFGSTPTHAHSKPTTDFGLDDSDSRKSSSSSFGSSDSSSSWSDSSSSDSGPSSDW